MNSQLDNNSDAIYLSLMALLQSDVNELTIYDQEQTAIDMKIAEFDVLDVEEINFISSDTAITIEQQQQLNYREIPSVESRFQQLLKTKLQAEIALSPPLFPWETEILDYEADIVDESANNWISPLYLWTAQLSNFRLPVTLPEEVLASLLDACTETMRSGLQQGAKMVRAVETLFPDNSLFLNQLAGNILMNPSRSPQQQQLFNTSYEQATPQQQMGMSLVAAREIIKALTLEIGVNQSPLEREWQTSVGKLKISAQCHLNNQISELTVRVNLPQAGSLKLLAGDTETTAQSSSAGDLSIRCFNLRPNQIYSLEIQLGNLSEKPLILAIKINNLANSSIN